MIRILLSIHLVYEILDRPADFILNIQAASTPRQRVVAESLRMTPTAETRLQTTAQSNRLLRLRASPGRLAIDYQAVVDIAQRIDAPQSLIEMPISALPGEVLPYLYPSRYCESDKLQALASREFGHLPPGYARVEAIRRWVGERIRFVPGSSHFSTSAFDTLQQQTGVCRDFAHLMIALCRALNIPARFSSGLDYGADPDLGPTDFHAYVEVFLSGRWYLFDPSDTAVPMGLVRIGTGRDAADIAFATIFGSIKSEVPVLSIEALDDPARGFILPYRCREALSTDEGPGIGAG